MTDSAIQDLIGKENHCFGCGPDNTLGLRIKSFMQGKTKATATFIPQAHHCAGPPNHVNGGIISALIDCHSNNLAMGAAYLRNERSIGSDPKIWCVTAKLTVNFLKPTPIEGPLTLEASITKQERRKTFVFCEVKMDDLVVANGEVLLVELKPSPQTSATP